MTIETASIVGFGPSPFGVSLRMAAPMRCLRFPLGEPEPVRRTSTEKTPVPAKDSYPKDDPGLPLSEDSPPKPSCTHPTFTMDMQQAMAVSVLSF